jgi:hypothetical protein
MPLLNVAVTFPPLRCVSVRFSKRAFTVAVCLFRARWVGAYRSNIYFLYVTVRSLDGLLCCPIPGGTTNTT